MKFLQSRYHPDCRVCGRSVMLAKNLSFRKPCPVRTQPESNPVPKHLTMVTGSSGFPYTASFGSLPGTGSGRRLRTVRIPAHTNRRVSEMVDSLHSAIKAFLSVIKNMLLKRYFSRCFSVCQQRKCEFFLLGIEKAEPNGSAFFTEKGGFEPPRRY